MKKLQFLLPFFFGASLSAFGANVTVIDEDGNTVASGGTLYSVVDSLPENVVMISGDITETKTSKFSDIEENMTLTIRGDSSQLPPTIAGNVERVQAVQNSIFQQTGNKKTLTLNVENVTITNPNGYVVCGINVNLNGNNAVFPVAGIRPTGVIVSGKAELFARRPISKRTDFLTEPLKPAR